MCVCPCAAGEACEVGPAPAGSASPAGRCDGGACWGGAVGGGGRRQPRRLPGSRPARSHHPPPPPATGQALEEETATTGLGQTPRHGDILGGPRQPHKLARRYLSACSADIKMGDSRGRHGQVGGGVCTHRVVAAPPVGATQQVERAAVEGEAPGRPRRLSDRPVAATPSPATAGSGQVTGRGGGGGGREVAAPAWPPAARTRSRLVDFPSRYFIRSAHHTRGTACGFDATHWPRGSVIDFKGQSSQCHIGVLHTKHILALTSCQHGGEVSFPHESRAEGLPRFIGCRRTES